MYKLLSPLLSRVSPCALPSKKGDGFCDPKNNNAGCDWDGGDCCPYKCSNNIDEEYLGEYWKYCKCEMVFLKKIHAFSRSPGRT